MPKRKRAKPDSGEGSATTAKEDLEHSVLSTTKGGSTSTTQDATSKDGVEHFQIPFNDKTIICERRGVPAKSTKSNSAKTNMKASLIFTHGAGGGLSNAATKEFAEGFAELASIVSFQGTMNLTSRVKSFGAVIEHEKFSGALGGRSMGARAAVLSACQPEHETKALVLGSFPLVGAQKGDSREKILIDLPQGIDVLFISGDKDSMCDLQHLEKVRGKMKARSWIVAVEGADHGMSWKSKKSVQAMRRLSGAIAARWLVERDNQKSQNIIRLNDDGEAEEDGWSKT